MGEFLRWGWPYIIGGAVSGGIIGFGLSGGSGWWIFLGIVALGVVITAELAHLRYREMVR